MTTLIIDAKKHRVYADGRMTSSDSVLAEKTVKCWAIAWRTPTTASKQSCLLTGAGDWAIILLLRDWLAAGTDSFPAWAASKGYVLEKAATASVYLLAQNGGIWAFMPPFYRPERVTPESRYLCDGSGYLAASGALEAFGNNGMCAAKALKIACKLDMGSGGRLSRFFLADDGSLVQEIIRDC